ncbi:hypothetical protein Meth11DRAFT_0189 [Methylophilaceae bacterium 11]|nr:hypothetical protein Meth11DRAFT_0189 [Methylophilaceae bacterium 11]
MDVILNLWQEQLHHIIIYTKEGRKLSIRIDQDTSGYLLNGEFFEITDNFWYLVSFSQNRVGDPIGLLKVCLSNLHEAMKKKTTRLLKSITLVMHQL